MTARETAPPRVTETGRASGIADTAHGHDQGRGRVSTAADSSSDTDYRGWMNGCIFTTESMAKGARARNLVHGARRAFTFAALGRRLRHRRHRLCHRRRRRRRHRLRHLRHRRGSMVTAKPSTGSTAKGASSGDLPLTGLRVSRRASAAAALGRHCPRRDCLRRRRRRRRYLRGSVTALDLRRLTRLASSRR